MPSIRPRSEWLTTSAEQLAGRGFGLDAGDELAARRAHHLDLHEREALVEGLDDFLLGLGEVGRVVDDLAFLLGGFDQLVPPKFCACGVA